MSEEPSLFARADALLDQALDLPASERSAFLAEACGADAELHALVERLLASAEEEDSALAAGGGWLGALALEHAAAGPVPAGARIGAYRVVRELGRGGMATVYLAERADGRFEQQVALKVLERGLGSPEMIARFEQEQQILASAAHPGLSRLLDGGVLEGGRPYLVLEYVEGQEIEAYCDQRTLGVRERIELFLQVARAVGYAHRNLIVHRDIKPSNLLVTADGHAKLLDFGIAKLLEPSPGARGQRPLDRTETLVRLLTPAFASPEQRYGEAVTTASDIYQLGLLLHLLLTGRLPERPAGAPEADLAARRGLTPRALARRLRGDLEAILAKALSRRPEDRYASVGELCEDLESHLDHRPIRVRSGSAAYRLGRFLRRNAAAALVATAALAGLVTLAASYTQRLATERDRAQFAAARAERVTGFLRDLFAAAAPSRVQGEELTVRALLDRGAQQLEMRFEEDPPLTADLLSMVGEIYAELALFREAQSYTARAVALLEAREGPSSPRLGIALRRHGEILRQHQLYTEALAALDRSREILVGSFGAEHPEVAETDLLRSEVMLASARLDDSRALAERARKVLEHAYGPGHLKVAQALSTLGACYLGPGPAGKDPERALGFHLQALAIRERELGPNHPSILRNLNEAGVAYRLAGEDAQARRYLGRSLALSEQIYGPLHVELTLPLLHLAKLDEAQGELERARIGYERVLDLASRAYGADDLVTVLYRMDLARLAWTQRRFPDCVDQTQAAIQALLPHAAELGDHGLALPRIEQARCLGAQGREARAATILHEFLGRPGEVGRRAAAYLAELRPVRLPEPQ